MLKKDLLELCLLQLLSGGDKYGYEVLTPLRAAFPDTQESAIYALLRGLGKEKLTTWYMAPGGGGPDRKYYRLTPEGLEVSLPQCLASPAAEGCPVFVLPLREEK